MEPLPKTIDAEPSQVDDQSTSIVNQALLTLDQVKGAYETEAESHILQAIEENERNKTNTDDEDHNEDHGGQYIRSKSQRNTFLAGVPSNALHLFDYVTSDDNEVAGVTRPDTPTDTSSGLCPSTLMAPPPMLTPTTTTKMTLKGAVKRVQMMNAMSKAASTRFISTRAQEAFNEEIQQGGDNNQIQQHEEEDFDTTTKQQFAEKRTSIRKDSDDPESQTYYMPIQNIDLTESTKKKKKFPCRFLFAPLYSLFNFLGDHMKDLKYLLKVLVVLMIPLLGLSAILFYFAGNPIGLWGGSYSWWLLFAARLTVTFTLAELTEFILIDFIALETKLAVMAVGRLLTLMAMQAKGWPLITLFWGCWNFLLNYGERDAYWIHYKSDIFNMFNDSNPASVEFLSSGLYERALITSIFLGVIVMVKRLLFSLVLGKRTYVTFGTRMEAMMKKVLLVGEVAMLAQEIEYSTNTGEHCNNYAVHAPANKWMFEKIKSNDDESDNEVDKDDDDGDDEDSKGERELYTMKGIDDPSVQTEVKEETCKTGNASLFTKTKNAIFHQSEKNRKSITPSRNSGTSKTATTSFFTKTKNAIFHQSDTNRKSIITLRNSDRDVIATLLGEWEEPQIKNKSSWKDISIRKMLQFREALDYLDGKYPLSAPFGVAETRVQCMVSAQKVYKRLLMKQKDAQILHFDTIATLAVDKQGKLSKEKARALIRLFRPDRDGFLTLLDFVRSCDKIYKKVKLFRVATNNAVDLQNALEQICNIIFYLFLGVVISLIFGISPVETFTAVTGLLLPLSFLFSAAASKYFEGLLLVLVRQPYDIGDRIAISNPENDTSGSGSTTWYVDGITLFTTTVRNAATNEVATYNNGSLAPSRIINAARSPKAICYVKLKFGIDIPYDKIKVFKGAVENFVKERPREWLQAPTIRATVVEADLGYIGYVVVLNHVEKWQNMGIILQSQADVASFCLEVQKKMDMRFIAPPMPIDLRMQNNLMNESFPEVAKHEMSGFTTKDVDAPNLYNFLRPPSKSS